MLDYLHSAGLKGAFDALKVDAGLDDFDPDAEGGKAKWRGLLEKKWTSVIRLQKKVSSRLYEIKGGRGTDAEVVDW